MADDNRRFDHSINKGKSKSGHDDKGNVEDVFSGLDIDLNAESNLLYADTQYRINMLSGSGGAGSLLATEAAKTLQRTQLVNPIKLGQRINAILKRNNLSTLGEGFDPDLISEISAFASLAVQQRLRNVLEDSLSLAKHRTGIAHELFLTSVNDPNAPWSNVPSKPQLKTRIEAKIVITNDPRMPIQAIERDAKNSERRALEEKTLNEQDPDMSIGDDRTDDAKPQNVSEAADPKKLKRARDEVGGYSEHASAQSTALMALGGVKKWMLGGLGETGRQLKKRTQDDISRTRGVGHQAIVKSTMSQPEATSESHVSPSASSSVVEKKQAARTFLRFGQSVSNKDAKVLVKRGFTPTERRKITVRDVLYVLARERGKTNEAILSKFWAKVQ